MLLTRFYPETAYGGFTDADGTVAFYTRVNALLDRDSVVVDFGCGRGCGNEDPVAFRRNLMCLRRKVRRVIGTDISDAGYENPFIDEFRPLHPSGDWPVAHGEADLIVCDSVVEHLPDARAFFREAVRVLKPGGYLCIRTTNVFSYVGMASRLIPNKYHQRVLETAQGGTKEAIDTFPTTYPCNTVWSLRTQLKLAGLEGVVYGVESEPRYLMFSPVLYALGVLHSKLAPHWIRPTLFAFCRKPLPRSAQRAGQSNEAWNVVPAGVGAR